MHTNPSRPNAAAAFTLAETLISISILGIVFSGTLLAYTRATQRAEWSGYSLAAQSICVRTMEGYRAVLWDTQTIPVHDDTVNIPAITSAPLDIPMSGTNAVWVTNYATVTPLTLPGPSYVKMITVNTVWPWNGRWFTNTMVTYRTPDQ